MLRTRALLAMLALSCAERAAIAEDDDSEDADVAIGDGASADDTQVRRYALTTAEQIAIMVPPAIWYWANVDFNQMDWDLLWDWESWTDKLIPPFDAVRMDTNSFYTNAVRHPIQGVLHYQAARANDFGPLGASLINLGAAVVWEYLVEYREYPSLNDLVVNVGSGFAIGEPMLQVGRFLGGERGTPAKLGSWVLSPFDALHGKSQRRCDCWYRLDLGAGAGGTRLAGDGRGEAELTLDLDLVTARRHLADGARSEWTQPGAWNRLGLAFRITGTTSDDGDELVPGIHLHTRTTVLGKREQDVRSGPDGPHGSHRFTGVASAFSYDRRKLNGEWDRVASAHLVGALFELGHHAGARSLQWDVAGYADFTMVQAHLFAADPPFDGELTSVLRAQGYYYGAGLSAMSRLRLSTAATEARLDLDLQHVWSIDGRDRQEINDRILDPHDLSDLRLGSRLSFDVRPGARRLAVGAVLEAGARRGTWRDQARTTGEASLLLRLSASY